MYWLYDTIKFLVLVALVILVFRKVAEAIRKKSLTWDTVTAFFSGLQRTIRTLNDESRQRTLEEQQNAQAAVRENTEHINLAGEESILILGKNHDLIRLYVILYILTAITLLFFGLASEEFGLTILFLFVAAIIIWIIYALENYLHSLRTLVVTNKRIYYRFLSHRVDLPLDFVTAVGTHNFMTFIVSTPSGALRIPWIENNRQVHETVVSLLLARQTAPKKDTTEPETVVQEPEVEPLNTSLEPEAADLESAETISSPEPPAEEIPAEPAVRPAVDMRYPDDRTDWFAPPVRQESRLAEQGMRIGRCVMCRRIELPVKTVTVILAGVERKRTLCEKCAAKHGAADPSSQSSAT